MKKFNLNYNHNIFEEPYNQKEVRKTAKLIEDRFGKDVRIIVTHTRFSAPNPFFDDADFIMVEHSFDLTSEDKKDLANIMNKSVTKLKSYEPIDVVVSFRKINEDDLYVFDATVSEV